MTDEELIAIKARVQEADSLKYEIDDLTRGLERLRGKGTFILSPKQLHVRYDPGGNDEPVRYPTAGLFHRGRDGLCDELIEAMAKVIESLIAAARAKLEAL